VFKKIVEDEDETFNIWNNFSKLAKNKYKSTEIFKEWQSLKKRRTNEY